MSIVNADYQTALTALQGHLAFGTQSSAAEMKTLCNLLRDAASRYTASNVVVAAAVSALTPLNAGACAANAGATAAAVIATQVAALTAGEISVPSLVSNTAQDG